MDIRVKTILDFIQGQKGYENAVIAGGAIRDYHYELEPKDYDIFIPLETRQHSVKNIVALINKEFNLGLVGKDKGKEYDDAKSLRGVTEITFEGKVFDIIGKPAKNDETFGFEVIKDFDFGNSMAFYNGLYIEDSNEHWKEDTGRSRMTLVNINRMSDLPRHLERFNNFNKKLLDNKGWTLSFQASCLSIKNGKKEEPKPYMVKKPIGGVWNPAGEIPLPADPFPLPRRDRVQVNEVLPDPWDARPARDIARDLAARPDPNFNPGPARGADGRFQRRDAGLAQGAAPVDWARLVQGQVINAADIRPVGQPIAAERLAEAVENEVINGWLNGPGAAF